MKMLFILLFVSVCVNLSSQTYYTTSENNYLYSLWEYESIDSLYKQRVVVSDYNEIIKLSGANSYVRMLETLDWIDYKIECYNDSLKVPNYEFDRSNQYIQLDTIPGSLYNFILHNNISDSIIYRKVPYIEDFHQWRINKIINDGQNK